MEEQTAQPKKSIRWLPIYTVFSVLVFFLLSAILGIHLLSKNDQIQSADYIEGQPKDQIIVALSDEVTGIYPNMAYSVEELALSNSIFEGLTILRNGRVQPALAESWTNPDDLTWRVKLRKASFHNGSVLKASDVKYSIEETQNNSDWVSNFIAARIDSVNVIDDRTVELKTAKPDPTLMQWLVFLFILSEDQAKQDGIEKAVGTGAYKLVSFTGSKTELVANENYWAGAPKVKKIVYLSFATRAELIQAMIDGKADISATIAVDLIKSKLTSNGFRILKGKMSDVSYMVFDIKAGSDNPLSNLKVRQAILLGLDLGAVIKTTGREATIMTQFSSPDLVGFNTGLKRPAVDKIKAKTLLTEAGYPNGLTLNLDTPDDAADIANSIKEELSSVGIIITVNPLPYNDFLDKAASGESPLYLISYIPDTLDATDLLSAFIHTPDEKGNGFTNFTSYSNLEIDKILDKAGKEFDSKERTKIIADAQKTAMDDLPLIPLFTRIGYFAIRDNVAFTPAPFGYVFPYELSGREKATQEK